MSREPKSTVYIIDDHPLLVKGLSELINNQPDLEVSGTTGEWTEALEQFKKKLPEIIILDVTLKNANGIEAVGGGIFFTHGAGSGTGALWNHRWTQMNIDTGVEPAVR